MITKNLIYFYILFEFLHSLNGESSKGSLTFVIDDTGSMTDDIEQVKEKTNKLFDAVLNSNATKVDDFILVTFNDPGTKLRTITRDRNEFKRALAAIVVGGGDDCPEYAMSGIELALEKSKPNSLFYVYTDASAKDYALFDRVKSLSLKKSTKVTFLLTGQCNDLDTGFLVYNKLADATSGEVFHIEKQDINKIIDYIIETVKHVKTTLAHKNFESSGKTIQFNVDSKSWDVIVSVSGTNPNFRVIGPDGVPVVIKTDESKITKTTRMEKLIVNPGLHTISLDTFGPTSVVVTASTSVTFEHGFSTLQPESLNETATKPFPGDKSYLAISLDNYKKDVKLKTVEIRDPDDNVISAFSLKLINEDTQFYLTKAFKPPSKTFKLAVIGYTVTGEKIVRLGSTTIEPQDDKSEKIILHKKPTATIIGGPKKVEYDHSLTIKCKVHAYPKPTVIWQDSTGSALPSILIAIDLPYDYISTLNLHNVRKNTTLTCNASNINGDNKASVNVELNTYLQILEQPKDTTIGYGESFTFKLNLNASPPTNIVWFKNSAVITSTDNYNFSSDNYSLTINKSNFNIGGVYQIKVSNGYHEKIITFKVSIYAETPKIDESNSYFMYKEGSNVTINCNVIRGVPKPEIFWSYVESGETSDLDEKSDTLQFENATRIHTGIYKCTAANEIGEDVHEIRLIIAYPPSIRGKDENIKVLKGKKVKLECPADGEPKPSIKWFKNNVALRGSATHHIYNEHMRFEGTFRDTGIYSCEAINPLGTAKKVFDVNVYEKAYIKPPNETVLYLNVGSSLPLQCEAHGFPKPEVRWIMYGFTSKISSKTLRGDEMNTLTIPRIQIEDQGLYVCMANNTEEENAYLTYEVHVMARPSIVNTLKDKTLIGVVGDLILRIPCKTVGSPTPIVTWMLDDDYLAVGTDIYDVEEDGTLLIKNLTKKSEGTYRCKAENSVGSATDLFSVEIQEYPYPRKPTENILLEEGQSTNITCDLPHKERDLVRWYKDGKIVATNELQLKNVLIEDSGIYTCRVSTIMYSFSSDKMITVGNKPKFYNEEETNIDFSEGDSIILGCNAYSYPPPEVKWYYNGLQIKETSMEMFLQMNYSDIGNFTCTISNAFGEITRTFNIAVHLPQDCILNIENDFNGQQPLILTNRNDWHPLNNTGGFVIIPKMGRIVLDCPESYVTDKTSRYTERVIATCLGNSTFKINEKNVVFQDLKCYKENKPLGKLIDKGCGLNFENTQLLTVGFNIRSDFLRVYDVCIDKDKKVPIYAIYELKPSSANVIPKALINTKYTESKHLPYQFDYMYDCSIQKLHSFTVREISDTCCFTKRQLVSPKDVLPGLAQKATYNYLNVVPHWSTCGTENWEEVEYRVRKLVKSRKIHLYVWTGSSQLIESDGTDEPRYLLEDHNNQPISPYIWKVLHNPENDEALAIIQTNIPNLMLRDAMENVPCKDICAEIEWMQNPNWYDTSKGFTICCRLEDFQNVFGYTKLFIKAKHILKENILPKFALA